MSVPRPEAELPPPSAELVLIVALVRAWLRSLSKRERKEVVRYVSELLSLEVESPNVVRLRPASADAEVAAAKLQAEAYWRAMRELLIPVLAEG